MGKGRSRWQKLSAYELAKASLQDKAMSPEEASAGRVAREVYRAGGRPDAHLAPSGKIVVR